MLRSTTTLALFSALVTASLAQTWITRDPFEFQSRGTDMTRLSFDDMATSLPFCIANGERYGSLDAGGAKIAGGFSPWEGRLHCYLFIEDSQGFAGGAHLLGPSDRWGTGNGAIIGNLPESTHRVGAYVMTRRVDMRYPREASVSVWITKRIAGREVLEGPFVVATPGGYGRSFIAFRSDQSIVRISFCSNSGTGPDLVPLVDDLQFGG